MLSQKVSVHKYSSKIPPSFFHLEEIYNPVYHIKYMRILVLQKSIETYTTLNFPNLHDHESFKREFIILSSKEHFGICDNG